jgi:putative intracellular protease/amidase
MEFFNTTPVNAGISMRGANVIVFLGEDFSHQDLQKVTHYIEDLWGSGIILSGLTHNVTADDGTQFTDLLIIEESTDILRFDGIFIPGGNLSPSFITDHTVSVLLQTARDHNLIVAGCAKGVLVQASANLLNGKKFTSSEQDVFTIKQAGGLYVENSSVVTDANIITATSTNYEELSYAIANALGYSYILQTDLEFNKQDGGWNYTLIIELSDKKIVEHMNVSLFLVENQETRHIKTITLEKSNHGNFLAGFGILPNGDYIVDCKTISIYNHIEIRERISEFSVGAN